MSRKQYDSDEWWYRKYMKPKEILLELEELGISEEDIEYIEDYRTGKEIKSIHQVDEDSVEGGLRIWTDKKVFEWMTYHVRVEDNSISQSMPRDPPTGGDEQ